ncbi:MAG: hypothetical protein R3C01_07590 [Planctomycetaceae bacterium]
MLIFKPAIRRNDLLFELPRPVVSLRIQDSWDFARFKVPQFDGDFLTGHSQNGVDVSIEGRIGSQGGELTLTEGQMFAALEALREALSVQGDDDTFEFFLYHDAESQTFRSLRGVSTVRFEYDLSDKHLFTYSLTLHAADPTIYQ